jgi:hypothetical protein
MRTYGLRKATIAGLFTGVFLPCIATYAMFGVRRQGLLTVESRTVWYHEAQ